ncbi:MAG: Bacterial alpha-L-rhamnosidase [Chitinivibrionales bacterium]|nr:Bacterial alpha-L-rhamnosidase [Chitinivibrionales bacterium]
MAKNQHTFRRATAVWPEGLIDEMNVTIGFRTQIECSAPSGIRLRLTGASLFRVWVNGEFLAHGPARAPHGFARVDTWELAPALRDGANVLAIEVVSYNVNSFYTLERTPFLQAEVLDGSGDVVAWTGADDGNFAAVRLTERIQKVQRYSFQRGFSEAYRLAPGFDAWRTGGPLGRELPLTAVPGAKLLPRRLYYPTFEVITPQRLVARGTMFTGEPGGEVKRGRTLEQVGKVIRGFTEDQLEITPCLDVQRMGSQLESCDEAWGDDSALQLAEKECAILDMGHNTTGFIELDVECAEDTVVWISFDEMLIDGDVRVGRLGCALVPLYLQPGEYHVELFEPYVLKYLKLTVLEGSCRIAGPAVREYAHPAAATAGFEASDRRLGPIFDAAVRTFRQNAVDTFMDCPSRERAGWLCDSFFTARTAYLLTGDVVDETAFIENYLLPERFENLPEGMLPMCYPADVYQQGPGRFIPQWALWFVVQLAEYAYRGGDSELIARGRSRVAALFRYFEQFRNDKGLLEDLEGWRFIEWSEANSFVDGVNYPTNMLYGAALEAAGRIYDKPAWCTQADKVHAAVMEGSFDGTFFVDQAVREGGELRRTENRTEVCQYYAFFFGTASPDAQPALWETLRDEFGIQRRTTNAYPDIPPANALVGNFMRLELLAQFGEHEVLAREIDEYFGPMAELTGTLWENDSPKASCNHGFASHAAVWLLRDILGLHYDRAEGEMSIEPAPTGLDRVKARLPWPTGTVVAGWRTTDAGIETQLDVEQA